MSRQATEVLTLSITLKTAPKRPRYLDTVITSVIWSVTVWSDRTTEYMVSVESGWHIFYVASEYDLADVLRAAPEWAPRPPEGWLASLAVLVVAS